MKLLTKNAAKSKLVLENDSLIESNIRLRAYFGDITKKLNTLKENYDPEKLQKAKEFELFCADLQEKKAKLLEELAGWQKLVKEKKDIFYGLIAKQDALNEKKYLIDEENKKLDLREAFVLDLEEKVRNSQQP